MTHDPANALNTNTTPFATVPPRNLLVIRLTALGDIVQCLQVVQSLARQWPACRITWVARDTFAPLVENVPFVHEVIPYRRKEGWRGLLEAYRKIRRQRFDLVWDMHSLIRSASMTFLARATHKWGKKTTKGFRGLPYDRLVLPPFGPGPHHAMATHQQFLYAARLDPTISIPLSLKPISPTSQFADEWKPFFSDTAGPLFVMFTDSSRADKIWNGYDALSHLIWAHIPHSRIVWCGLSLVPPPSGALPGRFLDLQRKCTLPQMITVVRQPSIFIGNDSGPMHLSAALGNRVLALFGPTSPKRFAPWPPDAPNTQVAVSSTHNLADLSPAAVFDALQTLLRRGDSH